MKINKKNLVTALVGVLGVASIFAATPSYAYGHYPHHYYPHHYYPHHHGGGNLLAGLFFGTAFGMMAGAAMAGPHYDCQRVYYTRYCDYNGWGERVCYVTRHVRYVC